MARQDPGDASTTDKHGKTGELMLRAAQRLIARLPDARDEILAVLNGAIGDKLAARQSPLALDMQLFVRDPSDERLVPLDQALDANLCRKSKIVLLMHGLMGSQLGWTIGTGDGPGPAHEMGEPVEFGRTLADELDRCAVYLRYNSGLHISINGEQLAAQLERLVQRWPGGGARALEIDIVAHSMGGLVARSAVHQALEAGHAWPQALQRVVLLGTPSHGATLEQLAHVAAFSLKTIWNPWTKLIGGAINLRADGIKDLRHGFCLEADWAHKDQDELRLQKPRPTRSPEHTRWFVAAGTRSPADASWAKWLGDGLVTPRSAAGEGFGTAGSVLQGAQMRLFEHTTHMQLMNDPAVLGQIVQWLRD